MSVFRTAKGKAVDMAVLIAKNEKTRAVGNMSVNARGDIVDANNRIIRDANQRVASAYQKSVAPDNVKEAVAPKPHINELTPDEREFEEYDEQVKK
jgi:hypothetical protein|tara:strand:+ start:1544 stop:1831 length:288 start_codon:yes stop_codon:yes gene_type:complete